MRHIALRIKSTLVDQDALRSFLTVYLNYKIAVIDHIMRIVNTANIMESNLFVYYLVVDDLDVTIFLNKELLPTSVTEIIDIETATKPYKIVKKVYTDNEKKIDDLLTKMKSEMKLNKLEFATITGYMEKLKREQICVEDEGYLYWEREAQEWKAIDIEDGVPFGVRVYPMEVLNRTVKLLNESGVDFEEWLRIQG